MTHDFPGRVFSPFKKVLKGGGFGTLEEEVGTFHALLYFQTSIPTEFNLNVFGGWQHPPPLVQSPGVSNPKGGTALFRRHSRDWTRGGGTKGEGVGDGPAAPFSLHCGGERVSRQLGIIRIVQITRQVWAQAGTSGPSTARTSPGRCCSRNSASRPAMWCVMVI